MGADIFLVIPAFRELLRLPPYLKQLTATLASASFTTEILIVDDGSPADEQQRLLGALSIGTFGSCRVLDPLLLPANHGKGYVIIEGWRTGAASEARWFGFVDADGAIPDYEVLRVLEMALSNDKTQPPCLWASRVRLLGKDIHRTHGRHLLGRIFANLVSKMIDLPVYDTQCGFKLIPRCHHGKIVPLLAEARFCFDIELLLAARHAGAEVVEIPIDWHHVTGGQIHPIRDGIAMLGRLPAIQDRAKNWPRTK
jgi:glycosyltransferase involved in cell wall biosynthesis